MTPTTITNAARAALGKPAPHQFGIVPSVPSESITAMRAVYRTIIQQLLHPDTAKAALRDWAETLMTASLIAETLDRGVPELQPHIDDMHRLSLALEATGQVVIDDAQHIRLHDGADVVDSIMCLAPDHVAEAAAWQCEQLRKAAR